MPSAATRLSTALARATAQARVIVVTLAIVSASTPLRRRRAELSIESYRVPGADQNVRGTDQTEQRLKLILAEI